MVAVGLWDSREFLRVVAKGSHSQKDIYMMLGQWCRSTMQMSTLKIIMEEQHCMWHLEKQSSCCRSRGQTFDTGEYM